MTRGPFAPIGCGRHGWLRIVLAFSLTWIVAVAVLFVSLLPERYQEVVLVLAAVGWVGLVSLVAVPNDAFHEYLAFKRWLRKHRSSITVIGAGVVVAAVFVFDHWIRERVPGQGWAGLAVQLGLLVWPFGVVLYQTHHFVKGAAPSAWILGMLVAAAAVAVPIVVLSLLDPNETLPWSLLLLTVFGPGAFGFLVLRLGRVQRMERAVPAPVKRAAAEGRRRLKSTSWAAPLALEPDQARGIVVILGVGCGILSSALLLASAIRVPVERRLLETSQVAERGALLTPIQLDDPASPTVKDRRALVERYSPVLRLHDEERWMAYDAAVALRAVGVVPSEDCEQRLEEPCGKVSLEDAAPSLPDTRPPRRQRVFVNLDLGVVYPRLVRVDDEIVELGDGVPKFARDTRWLAQYWLFYPGNNWEADSALGELAQEHGGDWEWVGVGLKEDASPVFVAYSAHCAGSWRPWTEAASVAVDGDRVMVGGSGKFPASHPLSIVARGSHANYATPGTREPGWGSCAFHSGGTAQAMRWLTFITAAREATPDLGSFQVLTVRKERDTVEVGTRALWWGEGGQTRLGPIRLITDEHGPDSPFYHHAWKKPIHEIFDTDWECDAGKKACKGGEKESG